MKSLVYLILLLLALNSPISYAQLPEVQQAGGITYISGGIGDDESDAIQAEAKKWPLMLQFSQIDQKGWGSWISGVNVKIFNSQKQEILNVVCDGPFLLLGLKPGTYVIDATYEGVSQQKNVIMKLGPPESLSIYWK